MKTRSRFKAKVALEAIQGRRTPPTDNWADATPQDALAASVPLVR